MTELTLDTVSGWLTDLAAHIRWDDIDGAPLSEAEIAAAARHRQERTQRNVTLLAFARERLTPAHGGATHDPRDSYPEPTSAAEPSREAL